MRIEWSALAVEDRESIYNYIERQSPLIAAQIDVRIQSKVNLLASAPEMGRPGRVQGTRELVIERTPFIAAYTVTAESIRILRVLHGAQRLPGAL